MKWLILLVMISMTGCNPDKKSNQMEELLRFNYYEYDLGIINVNEIKYPLIIDFDFTNISDSIILITHCEVDCKCIKVNYPKEPIFKGSKKTIQVTYNPIKEKGYFEKKFI